MGDNRKKDKHADLIVGLILIGISGLLLLILCGVFNPAGKYVADFFLGSFGLSFYGITIACLLIGILKLFKFRISVPVSRILEALGIYALFILAFHATSYDYVSMTHNYGEYIAKCYYMADTAGGAIGAIIMYPLLKVNYALAIVFVALLLFGLIGFAMFRGKVGFGSVRSRSVKYKGKAKGEDEDIVEVVNNELRNEDVDGNELKDFKKRSRFSKGNTSEYTPIEDLSSINDDEFCVEYKDNYAFDSNNANNTIVKGNDTANSDNDADGEYNKFDQMRNDARIAREKLYGKTPDDKPDNYNNDHSNMTDKDKFREAIDKIRNNEDPTYLYNLTSKSDDYEMYSIEARERIYRENMEKERQERLAKEQEENKDQNSENIENVSDNVDASDFNIDDIKLDDNDVDDYKFDNFDAFTSSEADGDNLVSEESHDDTIDSEDIAIDDIDDNNDVVDNNSNTSKPSDESVMYDIDDFSSSLDKKFEIKNEEDSPYDLPFYSRDEMYTQNDSAKAEPKKEDIKPQTDNKPKEDAKPKAQDRVNDIEKELLDDEKNGNGRKRRSDFGGTHSSQHPLDEVKKDDDKPQFINPFASMPKEEPKVEVVKEEPNPQDSKPYVSKMGYKYKAPPITLLREYEYKEEDDGDIQFKCELIQENLANFGIYVEPAGVVKGPTFSRLEFKMVKGSSKSVKIIKGYASDIEMWLGCNGHVNILAPIPGRSTIGIEIPNKNRRTVGLREVLNSPEFNSKHQAIPFALGIDIDKKSYVCDVAKSPHLLVAGSTGSGKSVGISALLNSILFKCSPDEVKLILIDPKKVELNDYSGLPHMLIKNPIFEPNQVINVLDWLIDEMERRYTALCEVHASKISEYNEIMDEKKEPHMPYILLVVDEVADLMLSLKKNLEDRINKLTAKSRAAGIHLVLATQRPTVDIITGSIKANLPSRIAFATVQAEDSRTIIGTNGAEKLLRYGDMLYMDSESPMPYRIQGAYIDKKEVIAITNYVRDNNPSDFDDGIQEFIEKEHTDDSKPDDAPTQVAPKQNGEMAVDERFVEALEACIRSNNGSTSNLQRKLGLGYPRAAKIHDQLEEYGFVQEKKVLITEEQFIELFKKNEDGEEN